MPALSKENAKRLASAAPGGSQILERGASDSRDIGKTGGYIDGKAKAGDPTAGKVSITIGCTRVSCRTDDCNSLCIGLLSERDQH